MPVTTGSDGGARSGDSLGGSTTLEALAPTEEVLAPTVEVLPTTEVRASPTMTLAGPVPGSDLTPGTRVGEYVIEGVVGRGGMGTVFAAVHPVIGKKAAIKVIAWELCREASFVERFVEEARAVNLIRHPNIVEAFSIGQLPDGRSYYAMEWLEGASLRERLRRGPIPLAEAIDILDEVADALEAVHEKGIVHRDLTPQNLFQVQLRGGRSAMKVFDFGLAKRVDLTQDGAQHRTRSGVMLGTPTYVSPEQACGEEVDHRTDVYALGVIFHEMIFGQPPFADARPAVVVARKLTEQPASARDLWPAAPEPLTRLLQGMLAIDPQARPALAAIRATLRELRPMAVGLPAPAVPVERPRAVTGSARRWWIAALLVAVAGGVVGLVRWRQSVGGDASRPAVAAPAPEIPAAPAPAPAPPTVAPPAPPPVAAPAGTIELSIDADGARVELDGVLVADPARRVSIPVARAGAHELVVTAPGRAPHRQRVVVAEGAVVTMDIALDRARPAPARRKTRPRGRPRPPAPTSQDDPDYLIDPQPRP